MKRVAIYIRVTGVENPVHLVASHSKLWRDSTNEERLNGENGLLLTPSIDHLFDRGFIGFQDNGALIISPVAHRPLQRMGIDTTSAINVGVFTSGQKQFLDFHREAVDGKDADDNIGVELSLSMSGCTHGTWEKNILPRKPRSKFGPIFGRSKKRIGTTGQIG